VSRAQAATLVRFRVQYERVYINIHAVPRFQNGRRGVVCGDVDVSAARGTIRHFGFAADAIEGCWSVESAAEGSPS